MSDLQAKSVQELSDKTETPTKRTPSKRLSNVEKVRLESVEMIKSMGGSLDIEGGRKTRSSTRGGPPTPTTPVQPSPAKKARQSSTATTPRRGRPKPNQDEAPKNDADKQNDDTESSHIDNSKKSDASDANLIDDSKINENDSTVTKTEAENEKSEVDASKLETIKENIIEPKNGDEHKIKENTTATDTTNLTEKGEKEHKAILKSTSLPDEIVPSKESLLDKVEPMEVDGLKNDNSAETTNNCGDVVKKSTIDEVQNENGDISQDKNKNACGDNECYDQKATKITGTGDQKENPDNCEPKILSPSADSVVETQICN